MGSIDFKEVRDKVFKGCGCLSIATILFVVVLAIIGSFIDDESTADDSAEEQKTEAKEEKKDSVIVNEP